MQSFMLPSDIHQELDQINRTFFWNKDNKYRLLIRWDKICKPKKYGGLGLNKSKDVNKSNEVIVKNLG